MLILIVLLALMLSCGLCDAAFLQELPSIFKESASTWAWVSYTSPSVAQIPGTFNRSAFDAPHDGEASDPEVAEAFVSLSTLTANLAYTNDYVVTSN